MCDESRMVTHAEQTKVIIITTRQKLRHKGNRLQVVYNRYIQPHVYYCSMLQGNASSPERINELQKNAARTITDSEHRAPTAPLLMRLHWLSLPERVKYKHAQLVFKPVKALAPNYMCELFQPVSNVSTRNTRSNAKGDLYVPKPRTQELKKLQYYAGLAMPEKVRNFEQFVPYAMLT